MSSAASYRLFSAPSTRRLRLGRPPPPSSSATAASPRPAGAAAAPGATAATPISKADVEAILVKLAAEQREDLDWRNSIVDLMKLLKLDSGLGARKQLAQELGYARVGSYCRMRATKLRLRRCCHICEAFQIAS